MYKEYLVTGATGFLGRAVTNELKKRGAVVRALVLPGDPLKDSLPDGGKGRLWGRVRQDVAGSLL